MQSDHYIDFKLKITAYCLKKLVMQLSVASRIWTFSLFLAEQLRIMYGQNSGLFKRAFALVKRSL